jgi:hypothetical protein
VLGDELLLKQTGPQGEFRIQKEDNHAWMERESTTGRLVRRAGHGSTRG